MARYIECEAACAEVDKGDLLVGNNAEFAKEIINRTPTVDVVPKSEVEELTRENESLAKTVNEASELIRKLRSKVKKSKSQVDNLKVLLEMKEKAYEGLKELYDTDTEALVKAREKTEVEVAREIFEEFTKHKVCTNLEDYRVLAELKNKYTEEQE